MKYKDSDCENLKQSSYKALSSLYEKNYLNEDLEDKYYQLIKTVEIELGKEESGLTKEIIETALYKMKYA
ncbi:hypothetical protein OAT67_07185 [Bacteriovoracaceae bacterium]|nr:hypothetical protein [Bacteriovoracaceae bacterium]